MRRYAAERNNKSIVSHCDFLTRDTTNPDTHKAGFGFAPDGDAGLAAMVQALVKLIVRDKCNHLDFNIIHVRGAPCRPALCPADPCCAVSAPLCAVLLCRSVLCRFGSAPRCTQRTRRTPAQDKVHSYKFDTVLALLKAECEKHGVAIRHVYNSLTTSSIPMVMDADAWFLECWPADEMDFNRSAVARG